VVSKEVEANINYWLVKYVYMSNFIYKLKVDHE